MENQNQETLIKALFAVAETNKRLAEEMKDLRDWVERLKISCDTLARVMEER